MRGVLKNGPFLVGAVGLDGIGDGTPLAGAILDEVGAGVVVLFIIAGTGVATIKVVSPLGLGVADAFTGTTGANFIVRLTEVKLNDLEMLVRVLDKLLSSDVFRLRTGTADTLVR